MRTLLVAEQYPWPASDGYRLRLDHMIRGLAQAGEVDVVTLLRPGSAAPETPTIEGLRRAVGVPTQPDRGTRAWMRDWVRGQVPRRLLGPDWSPLRATLSEWLGDERPDDVYDLVWFSHVDAWWPVHDLVDGVPTIVDFDNLENLALRLRRRMPPRFAPGSGVASRARTVGRWGLSRGFDLVDERRWDRIQRACAEAVDHVVVCSELDRRRSRCANAVVVPNGASAPAAPVTDRRSLRGDVPTFLFVGALDYEPNTEAVQWLVREIVPELRRAVPDARVRIVGRGADAVRWTAAVDNVDLVGAVDDMAAELGSADVSIVPIRVGAGTRLKVVEALANHLPLVTTTVGCEGIEVRHDVHALIADDATTFAEECAALATDGALRNRLGDAGAELFSQRYGWRSIESTVAELARSTAG